MRAQHYSGLIIVAAVIVAAVVFMFLPQARMVDVAKVSIGPLQVVVEEEGKTRVIDRYLISAPVAGFARRIELDIGDTIKQGQVLVDLEPLPSQVLDARSRAEAQAKVAAAKAALQAAEQNERAARADAELAQLEGKRILNLRKSQQVSQKEADQAIARERTSKAARQSAVFNVEVARHELEAAKTALAYSAASNSGEHGEHVNIRSPISGSVLKIHRESEGVVEAGQALIEVGNPNALEVEVDVLSVDAVQIVPGTRVLFEHWGGEPPLEGRVRTVEPVGFTKVSALGVEEQRVLVIADIVSERQQWQRLGDGYRVDARFIIWEADKVHQIPASALFQYQDGWAVFVAADGYASLRQVTVGQRNGLVAQIVKGLKVGEQVIIYPDDSIDDGRRIKVRNPH